MKEGRRKVSRSVGHAVLAQRQVRGHDRNTPRRRTPTSSAVVGAVVVVAAAAAAAAAAVVAVCVLTFFS
jgi:hypothetical protein